MDEYKEKVREILKKEHVSSDLIALRLLMLERITGDKYTFLYRRQNLVFLKLQNEYIPAFALLNGQCYGSYCREDYATTSQTIGAITRIVSMRYNSIYADYNDPLIVAKTDNCNCTATIGDNWAVLLVKEEEVHDNVVNEDDEDEEIRYTYEYKKQVIHQCFKCGMSFGQTLRNNTCFVCAHYNECIICFEKVNPAGGQHSTYVGLFHYHDDCLEPIKSNRNCQVCKRKIKSQEVICSKCENIVINDYNYKPEPAFFYEGKYIPENKEPFFGVEIETEIKTNLRNSIHKKDIAAKLINADMSKDGKNRFYIKRDASIGFISKTYRGEGAFEIVSHPLSFDYWHSKNLNPFWEGLSNTAKVASSFNTGNCGIHVHISRISFDGGAHEAAFGWFIENRQYFVSVICERFPNEYTKSEINDYNSIAANGKRYKSPDHHCVVNYTIPTIEVRPFRGNLKKDRILKDIQFVHAAFSWTKELKVKVDEFPAKLTTNSFEEYINRYPDKYKQLITYINNNVNKLFLTEPISMKQKYLEKTWEEWLTDNHFKVYLAHHFKEHVIKRLGLENDKDIASYTLSIIESYNNKVNPPEIPIILRAKLNMSGYLNKFSLNEISFPALEFDQLWTTTTTTATS